MQAINVQRRMTHTYVGTFAHLDEWAHLGMLLVTPGRQVDEPEKRWEDPAHGGSYMRWARLPAGLSKAQRNEWVRSLEASLSRWGCHHEWDCCGCASYSTRVAHRKGRDITLMTVVSYNY